MAARDRLFVISGCSGGGKSSIIAELARRGHHVAAEPGRRIIAQGGPMPWEDLAGFLERAIELALVDRAEALTRPAPTFFDRGLIDAVLGLEALTGDSSRRALVLEHCYAPTVFMAPPWPQIYTTDSDRRHDLAAATAEYDRLVHGYPALGYAIVDLPKTSVAERADFIEAVIAARSLDR
ncbi:MULTISPECIES: AAA family ATPase [Sphingomonas]|uniref:AAA family ATPase n=1 Tax=Sphingomonas TaxID=13687 RepID=UPI00082B7E26|nr:AAA family ATPase [Sphingomonas sp. CCH10-B3]